jgi:hypothetical protein
MMAFIKSTLLTLCLSPLLAYAAGKAHEHGIARLDVAIEAGTITVLLQSPLDNLLGFEHPPRTDAERKQAAAMVARLSAAASMFRIDPAAQCTPGAVELASSALKLGQPDPSEDGHADIDGSFEFNCADAGKASYIDTTLFSFRHLQRVDVQVAGPKGQFKRELKRPAGRIVLTR